MQPVLLYPLLCQLSADNPPLYQHSARIHHHANKPYQAALDFRRDYSPLITVPIYQLLSPVFNMRKTQLEITLTLYEPRTQIIYTLSIVTPSPVNSAMPCLCRATESSTASNDAIF